ncbi:YihY/virulence factor BrkB family protein [Denitrobaculum tricleocarpae]|nr:YihY/virulence factor BrkB family protein [Denitrobaculum tricleocarpae]
MLEDHLLLVAAAVAFYGFLAIFPALFAFVTLYGLVADPGQVEPQLRPLRDFIPVEAYSILADQLEKITSTTDTKLSVGLLFGFLAALWSETNGSKALMTAMNIAYSEQEARGFVRQNIVAALFTVGAIFMAIFSLAALAFVPGMVSIMDAGPLFEAGLMWLRWVILTCIVMLTLGLLYRYGPNRREARFQWITPGAVLATGLWMLGSVGFSFYAANFGSYNETFGSLGAVVVLLIWFYLTSSVICLGARLNAELELQTSRDSTIGPVQPKGSRGAYVADNVASAPAAGASGR